MFDTADQKINNKKYLTMVLFLEDIVKITHTKKIN